MRFSCERCGKKYVVKDDLLPGRTYKSRCKGCGHVIVVKGGDGASTADDLAVVPMPDSPPSAVRSPTTPVVSPPRAAPPQVPPRRTPTPPPVTPPRSTPLHVAPAAPAPSPSRPGAPPSQDSRYIDLFDGVGFEEPPPPPAPAWPEEPVRRVNATVIPPPSAGQGAAPGEDDPFLVAARAAHSSTAVPSPAPAAGARRPQIEAPRVAAPPRAPVPSPRRSAPFLIGGVVAGLLVALTAVAILRPWRTEPSGARGAPPAATVPPPAQSPVTAEAPPRGAPPPAATAPGAPPPAETAPSAPEKTAAAEPEREAVESPANAKKKPESLSAAAVRKVLAGGRKSFDRCLENPSRGLDRPLPAKRISLRLTVEPAGKVSSVAINDAAVARAPVGHCLKSAALALAFPVIHGPAGLVDVPVEIPATPAPAVAKAAPPPPPPPVTQGKAEPPKPPPPATPAKAEPPPPAAEPPPPSGGAPLAIEFSGVSRSRVGGEIGDTRYSQNAEDAEITDRTFDGGALTYAGQIGKGGNSAYGGIGFYVNFQPGGRPVDAAKYKYLTIKLASPTTARLRVKLQGPDQAVASSGCYPVVVLPVSDTLKVHRVKLSDFSPESWCGKRGRSVEDTLPQLVSLEVVDTAVQGKPTRFSVGTITFQP